MANVKQDMADETLMEDDDGEIMDEEGVNHNLIRQVEFEKKARELLLGQKPQEPKQTGGIKVLEQTQPKQEQFKQQNMSEAHDEILCCVCMDARREVMILPCKHLVYCKRCDLQYSLKNLMKRECPICRKEYKKTMAVLYS